MCGAAWDLGNARALFQEKSAAVFQHVYDVYYGAGRSIYATPVA